MYIVPLVFLKLFFVGEFYAYIQCVWIKCIIPFSSFQFFPYYLLEGCGSCSRWQLVFRCQPTRGMILWWRGIPSGKGLWDHWLWKLLFLSVISHVQFHMCNFTCTVGCNLTCVYVISWLHLNLMGTYICEWSGRWFIICIILMYRKYTRICFITIVPWGL